MVRQFEGEYNPTHWHSGHISAAGYLKLPDNFGATIQGKAKNANGKINFVHGSHQYLSSPISIKVLGIFADPMAGPNGLIIIILLSDVIKLL